jgi:hypothetical protein
MSDTEYRSPYAKWREASNASPTAQNEAVSSPSAKRIELVRGLDREHNSEANGEFTMALERAVRRPVSANAPVTTNRLREEVPRKLVASLLHTAFEQRVHAGMSFLGYTRDARTPTWTQRCHGDALTPRNNAHEDVKVEPVSPTESHSKGTNETVCHCESADETACHSETLNTCMCNSIVQKVTFSWVARATSEPCPSGPSQ